MGCSNRVRASDQELLGTYVTNTNTGKEELILQPDKTYIQVFSSPRRQFTNRGSWKSSYLFPGTTVELAGANLSEDDPTDSALRHGILSLQVHKENDNLKLARNEAADWYYERLK